jgi:hypothetical protein
VHVDKVPLGSRNAMPVVSQARRERQIADIGTKGIGEHAPFLAAGMSWPLCLTSAASWAVHSYYVDMLHQRHQRQSHFPRLMSFSPLSSTVHNRTTPYKAPERAITTVAMPITRTT